MVSRITAVIKIILTHIFTIINGFRKESDVPRVAIFRNDNIGDLFLSLPFLEETAAYFHRSNAEVVLFITRKTRELAEQLDYIDQVVELPAGNTLSDFLRQLFITGRSGVVTVLNPLALGRARNDLLVKAMKARRKWGFDLTGWYAGRQAPCRDRRKSIYTDLVAFDRSQDIMAQEALLFQAVTGSGYRLRIGNVDSFRLPEVPESFRPYCIVAPGGATPEKCWPPEKFAELIREILVGFPEIQILVTGTAEESAKAEAVIGLLPVENRVKNLCGRLSLSEFLSFIRSAGFIVANDSGPIHMAAAFGVKSLCILGGYHHRIFAPVSYRHTRFVSYAPECYPCYGVCCNRIDGLQQCIRGLSVQTVAEELNRLAGES